MYTTRARACVLRVCLLLLLLGSILHVFPSSGTNLSRPAGTAVFFFSTLEAPITVAAPSSTPVRHLTGHGGHCLGSVATTQRLCPPITGPCTSDATPGASSEDPFLGGWEHYSTMTFPPEWGSDAPGELKNEDPYLWMDARANWHFLAHRYDYRDGFPVNPNHTMPVLVSGHDFSHGGKEWHINSIESSNLMTLW